jgi:hypothetical protein
MRPLGQRRQEIVDGKRIWDYNEYGADPDLFYVKVVTPLRELKELGIIRRLSEIEREVNGRKAVVRVDISSHVEIADD